MNEALISIRMDSDTLSILYPPNITIEKEAEKIITEKITGVLTGVLNILEPVCTEKITKNELRRAFGMMGYKICS